ncbi:UDP-N-acetylmuramoyl-tripeptide--D-alanyl-D-alanine ligase [Pediococcus ethanolidurans]|uniref:UDP-N-acetylmuramoyl-tripeptide--D-alanyl-D- alanine ligase n=1 Tax=Pediococcus ethanolidurans TaxID=319653 RepID=UPI00345ED5B0
MKMQLTEIANAIGIDDVPESWQEITITSVEFDSRKVQPNSLFIPLKGQRDGHEFVENAMQNGAVATLWAKDHENVPSGYPVLVVDDPLTTLQKLAVYYLGKINPKVVAITGSNGKTTTKDMTAALLETEYNVVKTQANFNNGIGVPITLLNMNANTEVVVVEMGMDRPGQLDFLSHMAQPDTVVITMIGEAHIGFFGTRDKIADAKLEITHGLKEDGLFIYNGDEPLLRERSKKVDQRQYTFGNSAADDLFASNVQGARDHTSFEINLVSGQTYTIPMIGKYNVMNALAAIAVAKAYHIAPDKAGAALKDFQLTHNRTEWVRGKVGELILSDVYNSNPTAAKEVLASFSKTESKGKRFVVLGDMLELGEQSDVMHAGLADYLDPKLIEDVYLVGAHMQALAKTLKAKYEETQIHWYSVDQEDQLIADLNTKLTAEDEILIKGSHGIHLEKVLAGLQNA